MRMLIKSMFAVLCASLLQAASCPCPEAEAQREVAKSAKKVFVELRKDYEKLLDEKSGYPPQDIKARKDAAAEIDKQLGNIIGPPPQLFCPMPMLK